jgi:hypothetical protein
MTLAEVEAILGGPARDDAEIRAHPDQTAQIEEFWMWLNQWESKEPRPTHFWLSEEVLIGVAVDDEGRVIETGFYTMWTTQESMLDMLRRWLGL